MRFSILLFFVAFNSWALEIPLQEFDQSKLEFILRKIPSASLNSQVMGNFVRKFTRYPSTKSSFSILCEADYFGSSAVPSKKACTVTVSEKAEFHGDEFLFKISGNLASEMYDSLPYGSDLKKACSHERVYGQDFEGDYHNLFRFMITCKNATSCELRFTPKESY